MIAEWVHRALRESVAAEVEFFKPVSDQSLTRRLVSPTGRQDYDFTPHRVGKLLLIVGSSVDQNVPDSVRRYAFRAN